MNLQIRPDRRGLPRVALPPSSEPNASLASLGDSTHNSETRKTRCLFALLSVELVFEAPSDVWVRTMMCMSMYMSCMHDCVIIKSVLGLHHYRYHVEMQAEL